MTHEPLDDVLKALRDELAGVAPSPEFASQVRNRVAGELPLLREELAAVTPSPEFKVRVRQQIETAEQARRASWLSGWRWLAPVGMAAAVLLAVVLSRPGRETPALVTTTAATTPTTRDVGPVARPSTDTPRATATPRVTATKSAARTAPLPAASSETEPSLKVITNQPAILKAMWARAGAAQAVLAPTDAAQSEEIREIVIAPVEVSPVVVKWLVEPPTVPDTLPVIRRGAAYMAERSTK
jgi:hypothetical protein